MNTTNDPTPDNETTPTAAAAAPKQPTRPRPQSVDELIEQAPDDAILGCPSIVVYENTRQNLVIRQDCDYDDDQVVEVPYDRLPQLITILQRWLAKEQAYQAQRKAKR